MGSGEAKKFRAMYGSAGRHGDSWWAEEKDNVGMKLLRGMGWSDGQGLGKGGGAATAAIKAIRKQDNRGVGAVAATRDEAFRASQDLFNDVLSRLSGGGGGDAAPEPALGSAATSVNGMLAKRQLARRFQRGSSTRAQLGQADGDALGEIFGRRSGGGDGDGGGDDAAAPSAAADDPMQQTSSLSVNEYFAQRRAAAGLSGGGVGGGGGGGKRARSGFTLEDQADFAEQQMALAYGGRAGLGSGGASGADEPRAAAFRPPPLASAQLAPPPAAAAAPKAEGKAAAKAAKREAKLAAKAAAKAARKAAKKAAKADAAEPQRKSPRLAAAKTAASALPPAIELAKKKLTKEEKRAKKEKKARKAAKAAAAAASS